MFRKIKRNSGNSCQVWCDELSLVQFGLLNLSPGAFRLRLDLYMRHLHAGRITILELESIRLGKDLQGR